MRGSVSSPPHSGQRAPVVATTWPWTLSGSCLRSISSSARKRRLQDLQSTMGSAKVSTWPLATQTRGFMMMAASSPTTSSLCWTMAFHQAALGVFPEPPPRGPVAPKAADAAVDLAALEHEAPPLAQRDECLHCLQAA